ncbi:MAG: hypothetical protein GX100_14175 [candidate division WS1 bacterium]|nr:hypothetical protein [candidate division WS1 bacterium]
MSSRISFDRTYRTWNVLEDRYLGTGNELTVKVEPAGLLLLSLETAYPRLPQKQH